MFYWLDSFAQCLPPFFHQGVGSNAELILKKCINFFVKRWHRTTVETGALNIVEKYVNTN